MTIAEAAPPRTGGEEHPATDNHDPLLRADDGYQHLVDALRQRDRRIENLEAALHSSRTIGVAIGILMATLKCPRDDAFSALVICSNDLNRKLAAVAEYVEETGTLPTSRRVPGARPAERRSTSRPHPVGPAASHATTADHR